MDIRYVIEFLDTQSASRSTYNQMSLHELIYLKKKHYFENVYITRKI